MQTRQAIIMATGFVLLAFSAPAQKTVLLDAASRRQVIDSTCRALLRNYVYPEKAAVMTKLMAQKQLQGSYDTIADPGQFANVLTKDLRSVQADNHLAIRYDPDLEKRVRTFVATGDKDLAALEKDRKENFFFRKAQLLNGNIGYIEFTNFADTGEAARKTMMAALRFVANSDALILDLRNNFGGRPEMAKEMMACFFSRPQVTGRTFNRITNAWTEDWVGNPATVAQELVLDMPVYLLTSQRTFSAAEGFAYALQQLRNAVVVGETSRGGAHAARSFALGNGFVGFIPFTRSESVKTKTDWEGVGVVPTVPVGEDSALVKAQELILSRWLSLVKDQTEGRRLQWLLNDLQTQWRKVVVPEKVLRQCAGTFEEFLFGFENGTLFCHNTHQRAKKDRLVAISNHLFKIDDQRQVEFVRDKNGKISSIKLFWSDGWVDEIKKTR